MKKLWILVAAAVIIVAAVVAVRIRTDETKSRTISIGISPYQDIATIVSLYSLGLDKKYDLDVKLVTLPWENILPALASNGKTVDIGFASYVEFLTKEQDLNRGSSDPLVFIHPAYVFHGGSFITFEPEISKLDKAALADKDRIREFLAHKIGAQKSSLWEMMIYATARRGDVDIKSVKLFDSPLDDSLLAAERRSLDIASAGLSQMTEAKKRGGRVVLEMEDLGFADITGFVCRKSTLEARRKDIEDVVRIWFETVAYVMSDLDKNSAVPLSYLRKNSATQYTLEQYRTALSQEYFPASLAESREQIQSVTGKYSAQKIAEDVQNYMRLAKGTASPPEVPTFIDIR